MSKGNAGSIVVPCDMCSTLLLRRQSSLHGYAFCSQDCFNQHRLTILRPQRFWAHVEKTATCWLWTGSVDKDGYGKYGKLEKAHRLSWLLHYGLLPDNLLVCHHCDNPPCVRPEHLFLGTNSDNQQDAIRKGRKYMPQGEECSWTRVPEEDIEAVFRLVGTLSQRLIAQRLGLSQGYVSELLAGSARRATTQYLSAPSPEALGRFTRGDDHPRAQLRAHDIIPIFQEAIRGASARMIASTRTVTYRAILDVLKRRTWTHVPVPQELIDEWARVGHLPPTACPRGHALTLRNGHRICKECDNARHRARYHQRKHEGVQP